MAFFPASNGKGPCHVVGGLLKRMATKASLQRLYQHQIQAPHQLCEFAKQHVPSLNVEYFTIRDWESKGKLLESSFAKVQTVPETRQLHCFHPVSLFKVKVSQFSKSTQTRQETVTDKEHVISFEDVNCYVTVQYDGWWWLGIVTSLDQKKRGGY